MEALPGHFHLARLGRGHVASQQCPSARGFRGLGVWGFRGLGVQGFGGLGV